MAITDKTDFQAKVRASMRQLQNDPENVKVHTAPHPGGEISGQVIRFDQLIPARAYA